jgi:Ni/Co efflux regulator RcnB
MKSGVFVVLAVLAAGFCLAAGGTVAGAADVPPVMADTVRTDAVSRDVTLVRNQHRSSRYRGFSGSSRHYSSRHRSSRWRGGHYYGGYYPRVYNGPYTAIYPFDEYPGGYDDEECYAGCRTYRGPRYCRVYCGY